jgi:glycosyltransferase involved in cell wall biosynthesis
VVRTLSTTITLLQQWGHEVLCLNPQHFRTVPLPTYPDIPLSLLPYRKLRRLLDAFQPEAIHISTEGPIGWAGRRYCLKHKFPYTTTYHTRFPEYVRLRAPIPLALSYAFVRRFHAPAVHTMVATRSMRSALETRGFKHLEYWTRGVDINRFRPLDEPILTFERPIALYMGRVAVEKNIRDFLDLDLPGSKVVIGDGPARQALEQAYPEAHFLGYLQNGKLARHLASVDVMVFPSRTDTFGLVMLEAMACGVPVATYPVEGPLDVIINGVNGWMDEDLRTATLKALEVERASCRKFAEGCSWEASTRQFLSLIEPNHRPQTALPESIQS